MKNNNQYSFNLNASSFVPKNTVEYNQQNDGNVSYNYKRITLNLNNLSFSYSKILKFFV